MSQAFLNFNDLDSFEKYWSGSLQHVLNWDLSDVFLIVRRGIISLEQGDDHQGDINC